MVIVRVLALGVSMKVTKEKGEQDMFLELELDDFRIFKEQKIHIGKTLTAIAGHNATGKSTVLGILGNSSELKSKYGTTITDKQFKTEFSELFKGSKAHDKTSGTIGKISYQHPLNAVPTDINLRVTWQKWTTESEDKNRFRILNSWNDFVHKATSKTAKKLPLPSFYLGLSRLYPLGEDTQEIIEERKFKSKLTESDLKWLIKNYKNILSIDDDIESISNYEINTKRSGGVNTSEYDYLSNSSGQDNLMQILYLLLSFIKLRNSWDDEKSAWLGGLLLIDELDATLHPAAQIRLVDLIYNVSLQFDFQAIFTTHSLQILEYLNKKQQDTHDINIEYFTTANGTLQIIHNPSYEAMENDMLISNFYLTNPKREIVIYSEDDEARWMIKRLLNSYKERIQLIDIKLGGESLMALLYNDSEYFKNVLFILDGDKDLSSTKYKDLPRLYNNVLVLPGNKGPEALIYEYLISLPPTHEILATNFEKGLTLRTFKEMNPLTSEKYAQLKKDRDKYKKWFCDNKGMLEEIDVMKHWINDNSDLFETFIQEFKNKYNTVASRTKIPKLN